MININEIKVMQDFIAEFSPIHYDISKHNYTYPELISIIKDIADEL